MSADPPDSSELRTVYTTRCAPCGTGRTSAYLARLGGRDDRIDAALRAADSDPHGSWISLLHGGSQAGEDPFADPDGNRVCVRLDRGAAAYEIAVAGPRSARFEHPQAPSGQVRPPAASPDFSTVLSGGQNRVRDMRTGRHLGTYYFDARLGGYVAERASGGRATVPDGEQAENYIGAPAQSAARWHAFCDRYSEDLHRGIHVHLPSPLTDHVHDEREPRDGRAAELQAHFAPGGLGTHWTTEIRVALRAIANAADGDRASHGAWARSHGTDEDPHDCEAEDAAGTDVIFHAARPGERNRLRNREELACYRIGHGFGADEHEFPLKPGSPLRLTGISWRAHDPRYPVAPFEHADFPAPFRHVSSPRAVPGSRPGQPSSRAGRPASPPRRYR